MKMPTVYITGNRFDGYNVSGNMLDEENNLVPIGFYSSNEDRAHAEYQYYMNEGFKFKLDDSTT